MRLSAGQLIDGAILIWDGPTLMLTIFQAGTYLQVEANVPIVQSDLGRGMIWLRAGKTGER